MLSKQNCDLYCFFPITVLQQGQFKVETTISFQPHVNFVSTLKSQRKYNFQIHPYFNVVV